jgi:aspartyl-tRNA(Asn)/glutamyl-tRNA(Gln) amidotransferase subunit B
LEEDAGKSIHDLYEGETAVDLNRAGTPLLEIVSEPEISNAKEAVAYFKAIRQLVTFLDICDGNMAQGSMRCDVNVSVKKTDSSELGTRAELKNINSFKFIEKAINFEIDRQIRLLESGESVVQETRLYDSENNETRSMRSKEEANDYRYFPCPDLLPVVISDKELMEIKENLPELPEEKENRYIKEIGLDESEAKIISSSKTMANMFEDASSKTNNTKLVANWLVGDISALLNKDNIEIDESNLSAENFGKLIERISDNTISGKIAKSVLDEIWENGSDVDQIIESKGLVQIQDESLLEEIANKVIESNPDQVSAYKNGKDKLFGFFVGQVMKETQGKANPKSVNEILRKILS